MWIAASRDNALQYEVDEVVGKKQLGKIVDYCFSALARRKPAMFWTRSRRRASTIPPSAPSRFRFRISTIPQEKKEYYRRGRGAITKIDRQYQRGFLTNKERNGKRRSNVWNETTNEVTEALQNPVWTVSTPST